MPTSARYKYLYSIQGDVSIAHFLYLQITQESLTGLGLLGRGIPSSSRFMGMAVK